jgi:hypothetical protein
MKPAAAIALAGLAAGLPVSCRGPIETSDPLTGDYRDLKLSCEPVPAAAARNDRSARRPASPESLAMHRRPTLSSSLP